MNLTEMRKILSEGEIQLTRSLGQNFLHDANILRRIVETAEVRPEDLVLEIGPGLGPLTALLLAKSNRLLAIEMDRRLVDILRARFSSATNLELLHDDALAYIRQHPRDWSAWKLVANLPYSVASPLLVDFAHGAHPPALMVVTLQWEVARRLQSGVGDDDYGLLTLLVQVRYEPFAFFKIPPTAFFPEPAVDSACIGLRRRAQPMVEDSLLPKFKRIVKKGFSERRKMMLKLLKQDWDLEKLRAAFKHCEISEQIRAEAVTLEQFAELTRLL